MKRFPPRPQGRHAREFFVCRRESARIRPNVGPLRAACGDDPTGHNLLVEGIQMAKKKLKKGKKLQGTKTTKVDAYMY